MNDARAGRDQRFTTATWILLVLHAATLVLLCWQQKLTPDEANYLLAGCTLRHEFSFAAYNTVLHGPLAFWPNQLGVLVADPADVAAYAPWGRLGLVPFTLLAALALVHMTRAAFGAPVAFGALCAWCTNPLVLAHGCLMTADMALTCTSLWTMWAAWRWLSAPSWPRLFGVGVTLGATLATKYLGLLLIPVLGIALAWALARGFAPALLLSRHRVGPGWRLLDACLVVTVIIVVATCTLHAAYLFSVAGFSVRLPPPGMEVSPEDASYGPKSVALRALAETRVGQAILAWLPEPWVRGADYQKLVSEGLPTFFGDRVAPGFWTYYLVAFGTKLPLVALALLGLGVVVRRPRWPRFLPLIVGLAVAVPLVFLSGITRLQIGVRYALPVVPFLCLLAGRGLAWLATHRASLVRALSVAAVLTAVGDTARTWPRFLPAFNSLAPRPYLWFRDSTLDWRADAPAHDRDLAALRSRQPAGRLIDGALGPCFGRLLIHGAELAPRDPRDAGRIHHWLRRFWPVDSVGAWFAFEVSEATFRTALADDRAPVARGTVELAIAELGDAFQRQGDLAAVESLLRGVEDPDRDQVLAAATDLRSGDPGRIAAALLRLGRHDLVVAQGDRAPRPARAQALLLSGEAAAVVSLLQGSASDLATPEVYVLATALTSLGRTAEAIGLLEQRLPSDATSLAMHEQILRRLRQVLAASQAADITHLRR